MGAAGIVREAQSIIQMVKASTGGASSDPIACVTSITCAAEKVRTLVRLAWESSIIDDEKCREYLNRLAELERGALYAEDERAAFNLRLELVDITLEILCNLLKRERLIQPPRARETGEEEEEVVCCECGCTVTRRQAVFCDDVGDWVCRRCCQKCDYFPCDVVRRRRPWWLG